MKKEINYAKQIKIYIFLTFVLGGVFGFLDSFRFNFGNFIGSGIGVLFISVTFGYFINIILTKFGIKKNENADILDVIVESEELIEARRKIEKSMNTFRYSFYFALFFVIIVFIDNLNRLF